MRIDVTSQGIRPSERLRDRAAKKLAKFDRYFGDDAEAVVHLTQEGDQKCVEITIRVKKHYYRAETTADDPITAFDLTIDLLERQIRKQKTRFEKRIRDYAYLQEYLKTSPSADEDWGDDEEDLESEDGEIGIIRHKRFDLSPMTPDEAVLQMEMLGHSFLLFLYAETGRVALVYKRRDGNYGMIEPEY